MSNQNLKLKAAIVELFGSQVNFAEALGVDESIVSRIVQGRRELTQEDRRKWSKLLNAKPSIFGTGKGGDAA